MKSLDAIHRLQERLEEMYDDKLILLVNHAIKAHSRTSGDIKVGDKWYYWFLSDRPNEGPRVNINIKRSGVPYTSYSIDHMNEVATYWASSEERKK